MHQTNEKFSDKISSYLGSSLSKYYNPNKLKSDFIVFLRSKSYIDTSNDLFLIAIQSLKKISFKILLLCNYSVS